LQASNYTKLTFQQIDGTKQSVDLQSLVITFSDGPLLATNANGDQSFALRNLAKMYFSTSSIIGDVNRDGSVNISDVICIINYILNGDGSNIDLEAAELNGDGTINISDATKLINMILQ
ncbi:MAG: hypothetical protein J6W77_01455, partial [Prevotella sp.]|nr:hypothetical protein [Prevotella sp.]